MAKAGWKCALMAPGVLLPLMIRAISASTYPKQALNQPFLIQKSQALARTIARSRHRWTERKLTLLNDYELFW
jgi:hypothetical protein